MIALDRLAACATTSTALRGAWRLLLFPRRTVHPASFRSSTCNQTGTAECPRHCQHRARPQCRCETLLPCGGLGRGAVRCGAVTPCSLRHAPLLPPCLARTESGAHKSSAKSAAVAGRGAAGCEGAGLMLQPCRSPRTCCFRRDRTLPTRKVAPYAVRVAVYAERRRWGVSDPHKSRSPCHRARGARQRTAPLLSGRLALAKMASMGLLDPAASCVRADRVRAVQELPRPE